MYPKKFLIPIFITATLLNFSCSDDVEDGNKDNHVDKENSVWNNYTLNDNLPMPELSASSHYQLIQDKEIQDNVNRRNWSYSVLLPETYETSETVQYPVLYLLHGKGANNKIWGSMNIKEIMDYCHENYDMPEIIVVMPDAEVTYYLDDFQDNIKYETFFIKEFLPYTKENYKVSPIKENHLIGGFSMGGYGSAYYAMKYPEMFSLCYSMSGPLDGVGQTSTVTPVLDFYNPEFDKEYPFFILDDGYEDMFLIANMETDEAMNSLGIDHQLILRDGAHTAQFWKESLYLLFSNLSNLMKVIHPQF